MEATGSYDDRGQTKQSRNPGESARSLSRINETHLDHVDALSMVFHCPQINGCKRKDVTGNYKQCASYLEYSRNYAKEHPETKREIFQNWSSRNSEKKKAYRQERVDCPICKKNYANFSKT